MKKLLGLLAATGLVASSSISVVACGKKPGVSTDDSVLATKLLIDEFINDIGSRIYSHIESESVHTNLTREIKIGVVVNDFFSKENILKYGVDKNNEEATVAQLGQEENKKIVEAFSNLVESKSLETKINKLATDTDKYSILVNGGVIVKDIVFDANSFAMNYVNATEFVANASIRMAVNFTYIDYNQTVVSGSISNEINLRVTDDSTIIEGITNLEKNLANDLLNKDNGAVWNKATDNGYTDAELYKAFELYSDQKRLTKLNAMMNQEGWQKTLNDFITDQNYFGAEQGSKIKLNVSGKEIKSDKLISKIEPIKYAKPTDFYADNISLRKTVLQKYQANDDLSFVSRTSKGNKEIYDILNGTFKESYSNFKTNMQKNMPNYNGTNIDNDNILLGETVIAGLSLKFESLNFELPLNTLKLSYSFSLTGNVFNIEANSTLDKSLLGEAVYKNTEAGIKSFQENFGTSDSEDEMYLNTGSTRYNIDGSLNTALSNRVKFRVPLVFAGTNLANPLSVNIFDELGDQVSTRTDADLSKVNQTLSLETNNLSAVRYNLLNQGYQGSFGFKLGVSFKIVKNNFPSTEKGELVPGIANVIYKKTEPNKFTIQSYGYNSNIVKENQVGSSIAFQLDFNLLSVFIDMPETYIQIRGNDPDSKYSNYSSGKSNVDALFIKK